MNVTQNYVHTKTGWDNINPGFMVMTNSQTNDSNKKRHSIQLYGGHKKKTAGSKDAVPRTQGKWTIKPRITGMQFSSFTE